MCGCGCDCWLMEVGVDYTVRLVEVVIVRSLGPIGSLIGGRE